MNVAEQQTFSFAGNFHAGERDISLQGISGVTDISVRDITEGMPLTESSERLDVLSPASWGKFAVWNDAEDNSKNVEWYFNLQDATHTWEIDYTVHGAIAFDKTYDRLYWNIFSGYMVPIEHAQATVTLPEMVPANEINETYYRTFGNVSSSAGTYANGIFTITDDNFAS